MRITTALAAACCVQCAVDVGGLAPASFIYTPALQHTQHLCWVCMHPAAAQFASFAAVKHDFALTVDITSQTSQMLPLCVMPEGAANQQQQSAVKQPVVPALPPLDCLLLGLWFGALNQAHSKEMPRCTRASSVAILLPSQGITRDALRPVTDRPNMDQPKSVPALPSFSCTHPGLWDMTGATC